MLQLDRMKSLLLFSILFIGLLSGCAKKDPDVLSTDDLRVYTSCYKVNTSTASCYVELFRADQPSVSYPLEEDSIIACDGNYAVPSGSGYTATFPHYGYNMIEVTIVRPKAGSTIVTYGPLP